MMASFLKTFQDASRGIKITFQYERNFRIHTVIGGGVLLAAVLLNVAITDFVILLVLIGLVLAAEMVNTCIEEICNILRDNYKLPYEGSRDIRDIAAGMVWVMAIVAAIAGILILGQYVY